MDHAQFSRLVSFIWGIADDVLRDVYVRGKYRDVILPMIVVRRLDAVLEPTKEAVLSMKARLDEAGVANQDAALRREARQAFYNASPFRLRDLRSRAKAQQLRDDFVAYLDGFSPNVQEVLDKFKFRNQVPTLVEADRLGPLIEKVLDREINLSPEPVYDSDGRLRLPALDNHAMGTVFEELIRRFNEENNEEAGEHFTPRDVVTLMADLVLRPVADQIQDATYTVYDGACGTGGMLTLAEDRLKRIAADHGKTVSVHLYGQESQPETYAITKADLLLKGEGEEAENFVNGSTLSADGFPAREFDFMLSNPPYGKSWSSDLDRMGGKSSLTDPRFVVEHGGDPEFSLVTRSSDGQMLFLANKLAKMKDTAQGSRIAQVHNGSALFTGDAGQGESNIRQWVLENDWLEAIVALPLNIFYNTGIATYVWVLSNRKPDHRRGRVQLIDATEWSEPRRKNLGQKNCDLGPDDAERVVRTFLDFEETEHSRIFPNEHFGYWKVTVERPLRLRSQFTTRAVEGLRFNTGDEAVRREVYAEFGQDLYDRFPQVKRAVEAFLDGEAEDDGEGGTPPAKVTARQRKKLLDPKTWAGDRRLYQLGRQLHEAVGDGVFMDHNEFRAVIEGALKRNGVKTSKPERKAVWEAMSERDDDAERVVKRVHKRGTAPAPLHGLFEAEVGGRPVVVEYEPDTGLRDTEQVPLLEEGGVEAFVRREVLPYVPDAWVDDSKTKVGYEISFNRVFYKPPVLRSLSEIRADIEALEEETEGLLDEVLVETEGEA